MSYFFSHHSHLLKVNESVNASIVTEFYECQIFLHYRKYGYLQCRQRICQANPLAADLCCYSVSGTEDLCLLQTAETKGAPVSMTC